MFSPARLGFAGESGVSPQKGVMFSGGSSGYSSSLRHFVTRRAETLAWSGFGWVTKASSPLRHPFVTPSSPSPQHYLLGHPNLTVPKDRAGSMSEPAPVPPYPPPLPSTYLTPLKTLLSQVTMDTLQYH